MTLACLTGIFWKGGSDKGWKDKLGYGLHVLQVVCCFVFFLSSCQIFQDFGCLPPPPHTHTPFHTPVEYLLAEIKRFYQYWSLLKPIGNITHLSIPNPFSFLMTTSGHHMDKSDTSSYYFSFQLMSQLKIFFLKTLTFLYILQKLQLPCLYLTDMQSDMLMIVNIKLRILVLHVHVHLASLI